VVARDFAGNKSAFSNQVTSEPLQSGLTYAFYSFASTPTALPNYNNLAPLQTGALPFDISLVTAQLTGLKNYGLLFPGWLHISTAGNYQFQTTSVDGSAVYLGPLNSNNLAYSFP